MGNVPSFKDIGKGLTGVRDTLVGKLTSTQKGPGFQKSILKGYLVPLRMEEKKIGWLEKKVGKLLGAESKIPTWAGTQFKRAGAAFRAVGAPEIDKQIWFQYNPGEFSDKKSTDFVSIQLAGKDSPVHQWYSGGERIFAFQIFLDATIDSVEKMPLKRITGIIQSGVKIVKGAQEFKKGMKFTEGLKAGGNIAGAFFDIFKPPNGILDEVQKYQSLLISGETFRSPQYVLFGFGTQFLYECMVQEVSVQYSLFDKNLMPIRGTIDIVLKEVSKDFSVWQKGVKFEAQKIVRKGLELMGF